MSNFIVVADFKLFFGKYKGQYFSSTPASYQRWLVQTDFYKSLNIKYPRKEYKRDWEGNRWYEVATFKVYLDDPKPSKYARRGWDNDSDYDSDSGLSHREQSDADRSDYASQFSCPIQRAEIRAGA
jgi:hypothetical protein